MESSVWCFKCSGLVPLFLSLALLLNPALFQFCQLGNLEVPRGSDKTLFFFPFLLMDYVSLFVVFHKYVPPLLAGVSVGKPDGNFITRADQTNSDVRWLGKVVCGKPSVLLDRLLEKVTSVELRLGNDSVSDCWPLQQLFSLSLLAGLLSVASVLFFF